MQQPPCCQHTALNSSPAAANTLRPPAANHTIPSSSLAAATTLLSTCCQPHDTQLQLSSRRHPAPHLLLPLMMRSRRGWGLLTGQMVDRLTSTSCCSRPPLLTSNRSTGCSAVPPLHAWWRRKGQSFTGQEVCRQPGVWSVYEKAGWCKYTALKCPLAPPRVVHAGVCIYACPMPPKKPLSPPPLKPKVRV